MDDLYNNRHRNQLLEETFEFNEDDSLMKSGDGNHDNPYAMNNKEGREDESNVDGREDTHVLDFEKDEIENNFAEDSNDSMNHDDVDVVNEIEGNNYLNFAEGSKP
ncbi:conserved hypothetical protein [Ricinus communis]|uniref:Uncharacterized protein n=1 Tax=Ricinus communis TaxID=3988 RepID=B9S5M6_RICCO|nr:conserved hypothetical protein [Ricinus communis]